MMKTTPVSWILAATVALFSCGSFSADAAEPPAGFTALYNGSSLSGWQGGDTFDPRKLRAMTAAERATQISEWTKSMLAHWRADGEELVNDGSGAYATTVKEFGDFELLLEYKTVPRADSGVYLRGVPQVQIWDYTDEAKFNLGADKGSGGLWNNPAGSPGKDPLVKADKPFGEWNHFRILMVGARVSVWLNETLVVDHALMENHYFEPGGKPVPSTGPIQLQTHGGEIRWRNVFIREIDADEANTILAAHNNEGFQSVFNGRTLEGWSGALDSYEVVDGAIRCRAGQGGNLYFDRELADFSARLEFKLPPGGNNGLAIRYPGEGDPAYAGLCELQVLDNSADVFRDLDPRQFHGSAYGLAAAHRGYLRSVGEWNFQEVTVKGFNVRVELNGTEILNTDLSEIDASDFMNGQPHPGITNETGYFGFAGHNDPVMFRNIRIREE